MSEIKVDTLTGKTTANDITVTVGASATQSLEQGLAKAFLYFDSSIATPVADASFNIASITDAGTGNYDPNFTNAMGGVDYAVTSGISPESGAGDQAFSHPNTASQYSFNIYSAAGSYDDNAHCSSNVHGDLA